MSLKNKIATSNAFWTVPIKYFFYKSNNKFYDVNEIIKKSELDKNGCLKLELTDGTVFNNYPSEDTGQIQFTDRIKYGDKSKLDKILDVDHHFFLYELLHELYVNDIHYKFFDIKSGDTVVDCGANIGGFTIRAAQKAGPNGKVIAIEPDDTNMEILKKNCKDNGLENVIFVKKGLWNKKDTLEFFASPRQGEHSFIQSEVTNKESKISLDVDTLDTILSDLGIEKIDFLKMDIEGAEIQAFEAADNALEICEKWVVEAGHIVDGRPTEDRIRPIFEKKNYKFSPGSDKYRHCIYATK